MDRDIDRIDNMDMSEIKKKIKEGIFPILSSLMWILLGIVIGPFIFDVRDVPSPSDIITEGDIELYDGKVCILGDYVVAMVSDTNSMDPVMDDASFLIAKNVSLAELKEGDIIAYQGEQDRLIVHRVMKKYDNYVITKGDNNDYVDPYKVTEKMIHRRVVGILY